MRGTKISRGYSPTEDRNAISRRATHSLSLSYIVHIEKRCPININPRARSAVRADTILIDQREIRTRHIPNRRKQGKSIRSGSKRTHLRRDFSDRLHAIAIANMLRKRFRWGWWELGTSSRGLLLQIATESNYEERSWLRKIVEIYAWPLFVISQRKQIKMRIFICTNHKNLFFLFIKSYKAMCFYQEFKEAKNKYFLL